MACALAWCLPARALVWEQWHSHDSLPLYVLVTYEDSVPKQPVLPDSIFNRIAGHTIFRVNRTNININDPFLKELSNRVIPFANAQGLDLVALEIRGAASPEGPYLNNVRLSKGRALALKEFLAKQLGREPKEITQTKTIAEDYSFLLWTLEHMGDPEAHVVREIIEECGIENDAAIKRKLQFYNRGFLWRRLLNDVYPSLRAARIVLYFRDPNTLREEYAIVGPDEVASFASFEPTPVEIPTDVYRIPIKLERRHLMSVSSNLLYDAFYMPGYGMAPMPNVQVELFPRRGHFSFRLGFMSPYWQKWDQHKFFQIRDYHLEARYYFRPGILNKGAYLGLYANNAIYGIGLGKDKGWQGEALGGALKLGYVARLGSGRWRLDFHIAAGALYTRYDPYVFGNPITGEEDDYYYDWDQGSASFRKRNHQLWWLGPTEVGITLSYDLLYYKNHRKGVSMRRKEVVWY